MVSSMRRSAASSASSRSLKPRGCRALGRNGVCSFMGKENLSVKRGHPIAADEPSRKKRCQPAGPALDVRGWVKNQMVQLLGVEPRTFGSTIRRSSQLSYSCTEPAAKRDGLKTKSPNRQMQAVAPG